MTDDQKPTIGSEKVNPEVGEFKVPYKNSEPEKVNTPPNPTTWGDTTEKRPGE